MNYLLVEILKLRRSLVLLLSAVAPLFVAVMTVLIAVRNKPPADAMTYQLTGAAFWAFAMLPLVVTALAVLVSQMEHGPRTWDHWLTFPGARPGMFFAKLLVLFSITLAMAGWLWLLLIAGWQVVEAAGPTTGRPDPAILASTLAKMWVASAMMVVIQLWVALRSRSFVPPLALGITGTFVAVAAASAKEGAYFPWLMPMHVLASDPTMAAFAVRLGIAGGAALLLGMLADLNRLESI